MTTLTCYLLVLGLVLVLVSCVHGMVLLLHGMATKHLEGAGSGIGMSNEAI